MLWRRLGPLRVPVALIACGLAGIDALPQQEAAIMPTYLAAQFLLAAGFLRPQRDTAKTLTSFLSERPVATPPEAGSLGVSR